MGVEPATKGTHLQHFASNEHGCIIVTMHFDPSGGQEKTHSNSHYFTIALVGTAYLYNGCLAWYNVLITLRVHTSVQSQFPKV